MTKKFILIHWWEGYPEEWWRPWLRDKLKAEWCEVIVPAMPNTAHPKMSEWLDHLQSIVPHPDENCYFVGHSLGCITILRYLEWLNQWEKIGWVILVAGYTSNLWFTEMDSFFTTPINWDEINKHCDTFAVIHSDNDPWVSLHYADFFRDNLHAKVLIEHNKKHFSWDDWINELPVVFEECKNITK